MNRAFRLVFNRALGVWQVTAEALGSHGSKGTRRIRPWPTHRRGYRGTLVIGLSALLFSPTSAQAWDWLWTGEENADWFFAQNWTDGEGGSVGAPPGGGDGVLVALDGDAVGNPWPVIDGQEASADVVSVGMLQPEEAAELTVKNGGVLNARILRIGTDTSDTDLGIRGRVTITGEDSELVVDDADGFLRVGHNANGSGELFIEDGGVVTASQHDLPAASVIGGDAGASGYVEIVDEGSRFTHIGDLHLGGVPHFGSSEGSTGNVRVLDGGELDVTGELRLGSEPGSVGLLEIGSSGHDAPGYVYVQDGIVAAEGESLIHFQHGDGDYYFTGDGTSDGDAPELSGALGLHHYGTGRTLLTGHTHELAGVVDVHRGTLGVEEGVIDLTSEPLRVLDDAGFLVGTGGRLEAEEVEVGEGAGEPARLDIADGGELEVSGELLLGGEGEGTLELVENADAELASVVAGRDGGGHGRIVLTDSALTVEEQLVLGRHGTGTMDVDDRGQLATGTVVLGEDSGGEGEVALQQGVWNSEGELTVGDVGTGTVIVEDGVLEHDEGFASFGRSGSGEGTLKLLGEDADFRGRAAIGEEGHGTLEIVDGGRFGGAGLVLGQEEDSSAEGRIAGDGSRVDRGGSDLNTVTVGYHGDARLELSDGAELSATRLFLGRYVHGSGHLVLGDGETAGTVDVDETFEVGDGHGILEFDHAEDPYHFTDTGDADGTGVSLSGDVELRHTGSGITVLSRDYALAEDSRIEDGTLQVGAGGDSGSIDGEIENDGVLAFDRSDEHVFGGQVSGTGDLVQRGQGTLILDADQDYTGETRVESGTLVADVDLSAASARVLDGGTLAGRGTLGDTTVEDGGRLDPGNSVGTLTIDGDLLLSPESRLDFALGAPAEDEPDAGTSDRIEVTGDLTLDGTLDLRQSGDGDDGDAGFGYYRLMSWDGNLTDNELEIGETPELDEGALFLLNPEAGYLDMHVAVAGDDTLQHWQGGDGVWSETSEQWLNDGGEVPVPWAGNHGVFRDEGDHAGGTVDVQDAHTFKGLQFVDEGYRLEGSGSLAPDVDEDGELRVLADTAEIAVDITGEGELYKTEAGTAILTGDAGHEGGTRIESGALQVGDGGEAGSLSGDVEIGEAARLVTDRNDAMTLDGGIGGAGDLVQAGSGTVMLTGDAAPGQTRIEQGVLQVGDGGDSGTLEGEVQNAGTLAFDREDRTVFDGVIEGSGDLVQRGEGTLVLEGQHALGGDTRVESGRLQVDGDLSQSATTVADGASLRGRGTVGSTRIEDGGVLDPGASAGTLSVDGDLWMDPDAILNVALGTPGEDDPADGVSGRVEVSGDLTLDGSLDLRQSDDPGDGKAGFGYYRLMTWEGELEDRGLEMGETPHLEEDALYVMEVGDHRLDLFIGLEGDDSLQHWQGGDGTWSGDSEQWLNDGGEVAVPWAGNHAIFKDADPYRGGTVEVEGTQAFEGLQFVDDGYRLRGEGELETAGDGEIRVLASGAEIRNDITGSGSLTKTEAGTLIFSGDADHAGGTDVEEGHLLLDGGSLDHDAAETRVGAREDRHARLSVEDGASIRDDGAVLGAAAGALGEGSVSGPGSSWDSTGGLRVGSAGEGQLDIRTGGEVSAGYAYVGAGGDGAGEVFVSGNDSGLEVDDDLIVGDAGEGDLTVEQGARVRGGAVHVGHAGGAEGRATVSGQGSELVSEGAMVVGGVGQGALTLADGARAESGSVRIGRHLEGEGHALVTGEGTHWRVDGPLEIASGRESDGHLRIADGAGVESVSAVSLGAGPDSSATLEIAGETEAGVLDAGRVQGSGEDATLRLAHGQGDYHLTDDGTAEGEPVTLSGSLDLVHAGAGTTVLEGDHDTTGETSIEAGHLQVNGSLADSAVTVQDAALLTGTGTVGSLTVQSGGHVQAGNSVGSLSVSGDLTLESGSVHVVEVSADGQQADRTDAGGELTIEDGVRLEVTGENGADGRDFTGDEITHTVLQGDQGLDGTFDEVAEDLAFLDTSVAYTENSVELTLSRVAVFESAAATSNQRAVGGALDRLAADDGVDDLVDALLFQDTEGARAGLDSLSGVEHSHAQQVGLRSDQRFRGLLHQRMGGIGSPAAGETASLADLAGSRWASAGPPRDATADDSMEHGRNLWVRALGGQGEIDDTGNAPGTDYSFGGVALGLDTTLGDHGFVGVGLGFSRASAESAAADLDVDSWQVAAYGGWERDGLYVRGDLGGSYHDADAERDVMLTGDTAEASYSATGIGAGVEAGQAFAVGEGTRVTPFAGLDYQQQRRESFTESGAGQANLRVDSETGTSVRTRVGARLEQHFETAGGTGLTPRAELAWLQEHGDRASEMRTAFDGASGERFTVEGPELSRDRIHVNLGLSARLGEASTFDVGYQGEFASSDDSHAAGVTFRRAW